MNSGTPSLVEPSFDENVLRALCELDVSVLCRLLFNLFEFTFSFTKCGVPLLLDRIKQSMVSCKVSCISSLQRISQTNLLL